MPPVSVADVYKALIANDVPALKHAIFCMGVTVHNIRVWQNLPPLLYAARLGHFQQVRILLQDFSKYTCQAREDSDRISNLRWISLVPQALRHRETQKDEVLQLLMMIASHLNETKGNYEHFLEMFISCGAFEFMDVLFSGKEGYIPNFVSSCVEQRQRKLFQLPAEIMTHYYFVDRVKEAMQERPLVMAMLKGDYVQLKEMILTETTTCPKPEISSQYFREIARIVDVTMLESDVIADAVQARPDFPLQELLRAILNNAMKEQNCPLIYALVSYARFDKTEVDWTNLFCDFLCTGYIQSAMAIKHLVDDLNLREILPKRAVYKAKHMYISMDDFIEILKLVESLSITEECNLTRSLAKFPETATRPDLIETVSKFGLTTAKLEDILNTKSKPSKTTSCNISPLHLVNSQTFTSFLGPSELMLDAKYWLEDESLEMEELRERCVIETGKPLQLDPRFSEHPEMKPELQDLERKRQEAYTLKKHCRLAIRKAIMTRDTEQTRERDDFGSESSDYNRYINDRHVVEDIASLYPDLPRRLVDYLLYRDGDQGLYYEISALTDSII